MFAWKITDNNAKHKPVVKLLKGEIITAEFIHHPRGAVKALSPLFEDTGPLSPSVKTLLTCNKQKTHVRQSVLQLTNMHVLMEPTHPR